MINFEDELDKVYASEIDMFSCMNDGNCWNGQATIGKRCYYPIGYRPSPDNDSPNGVQYLSADFLCAVLLVFFS